MIQIRVAGESDAPWIREIFEATYGRDYTYPEFYDESFLEKLIHSDDTLVLVAEDDEKGDVVGTASVVLEKGAHTDLVGEFGRLAVHPTFWGQNIGGRLLQERMKRVADRLHVGFMEARVTHPFSLTNGLGHGFAPVGFLPLKLCFGARRESTALLVQYFGEALELRRHHPRIIPEAYQLAEMAMGQVGLERDLVVDEKAPSYPRGGEYTIQELSAQGNTELLRSERGQLGKHEIFEPLRLHHGFFRLRTEHSFYLIARHGDQIAGVIGFTLDSCENVVRVFEFICLEEQAVRILLSELEMRACDEYKMCYLEIDVSAHAPGMQRTLLELGYVPAAYVPAMALYRAERLDVLKMARLLIPCEIGPMTLVPPVEGLAELILRDFQRQEPLPRRGKLSADEP